MPGRRGRSLPGTEKITMLAPGEPRQGGHSINWGPPLKRPSPLLPSSEVPSELAMLNVAYGWVHVGKRRSVRYRVSPKIRHCLIFIFSQEDTLGAYFQGMP